MGIEVRGLTKKFGNFTALKEVHLQVRKGELVAILGPSGCGKTTLLRIIAGLEVPNGGSVLFSGEDATLRSVRDRRVGFVFQHYALFRHMTVFENIAFGLKVKPRAVRLSKEQIREKVYSLLQLIQLEFLAHHYPSQLSGGQRQRVALARALAVEPQVLLLDEPFGALDARVRKELRRWLRRLHDELHVTSVFVTHDQEEALEVADKVVVMNEGEVLQVGTPEELYEQPACPFVYNFLGHVNRIRGRVDGGKARVGEMVFDIPGGGNPQADHAVVYIRPHHLDIAHQPNGGNHFRARVTRVNPVGPLAKVELLSEWGDTVEAEIPEETYRRLGLKKDAEVFVAPKEVKVYIARPSEAEGI